MDVNSYSDGTTPQVCIIGAGFGGLTVALELKRKLGLKTFTIFEKNSDVGGTWLVNSYPGAECDVMSLAYSWSFHPNKEWTSTYARQPEILDYIRSAAKEYDLYSHLKTNAPVTSCRWVDDSAKFEVTWVHSLTGVVTVTYFDFVVIGVSWLWNPNIPKVFDDFTGEKVHTAQWDASINLENKVVGVVGSGLSAIQLIPKIVHTVKELHCFQRTTTYIFSKPLKFELGERLRWIQRTCPKIVKLFRNFMLFYLGLLGSLLRHDSWVQSLGHWWSTRYMTSETRKKPGLLKQLLPTEKALIFCPTAATNSEYLASLCEPNVTIHREKIIQAYEDKLILKNQEEFQLDVLILATGFKTDQFWGPMRVIGNGGEDILKTWTAKGPNTFYGVCTSSAKNLFFIYGPHSFFPQSAVAVMEGQSDYVVTMLRHMMKSDFRKFQVNTEAENEFMEMRERKLAKSIYARDKCSAGFGKLADIVYPDTMKSYLNGLRFNPKTYNFY